MDTPKYLGQHKDPLWQVATATIDNPDCDDATKMIALWIRRILVVESELEVRTETLYEIKGQRDKLLEALKTAVRWLRRIESEYHGCLNRDAIEKHLDPVIAKAEGR